MAARRLKFKPKPLVGLVRRNKDQNEIDLVKNNDLISDENTVNTDNLDGGNTSLSNLHETPSVVNERSVDNTTSNSLDCNKTDFEKESEIDNSNSDINKNNENTVTQNDLRCDINNKIKSVLSGYSLDSLSSSNSSSDNSNCISDSINNNKELVQDDNQQVNGNGNGKISDLIDEPHSELSSADNETTSTPKDESVNSDQITNPVASDSPDTNEIQSTKTSINEKKDNKNSQRILSRFGKSRLKPVLSNVIRNKKDSTTESVNKNECLPLDTTVITKTSTAVNLDNSTVVAETESSVSTVSNSFDVTVQEPEQKELQEKLDNYPIEDLNPDVSQLTKEQPVAVLVADSTIASENTDKSNADAVTNVVECENEESSIRTPVKLFQPNKRQRSHGQSYTSLTSKAMQTFKDKFKDGQIDKSKLMMRDLIFYNPSTNPMPPRQVTKLKKDNGKQDPLKPDGLVEEILEEEKVDDLENDENDSLPVPQVKVGPDGKIIIDPKSLIIEATGVQKNRENLEKSEIVQENEFSHSKFHKKKVRRSDWTAEETLLFYKALNDLGADFSLMQSLFPKRTRRDLKMKFKKEEKTNCNLIDKAMRSCGNFDFTALEKELKKDREERTKKQEEQKRLTEERKKLALIQKQSVKKLNIKRKSAAEREFNDTDRGVVRVGRDYESKLKHLLDKKTNNAASKRKENLKRKRQVRKRKSTKRKLGNDEEDSSEEDLELFDFRLKDNFENDVRADDSNTNSGKNNASSHNLFNLSDDDNLNAESNDFSTRILTKTRFGRQPKIKSIDPATDEYIKTLKKFKQNNTEEIVNENSNEEHFIPNVPLLDSALFTENNAEKLSTTELQEKLVNCYELFGEPLDLSIQNEIMNESSNSFNNGSFTLPIHDSNEHIEMIIPDYPLNMDAVNTVTSNRDYISQEFQNKEQLVSNSVNLQDVNESNCLYLPSAIENEETTLSKELNNQLIPNCTEEGDALHSFKTGNETSQDFNSQYAPQNPTYPSIVIKSQPGIAEIQVVSQEEFNYLCSGGSEVLLEEQNETPNAAGNEDSSHTQIYCHPSSDHTYTLLAPKPVQPKSTYLILTPIQTNTV